LLIKNYYIFSFARSLRGDPYAVTDETARIKQLAKERYYYVIKFVIHPKPRAPKATCNIRALWNSSFAAQSSSRHSSARSAVPTETRRVHSASTFASHLCNGLWRAKGPTHIHSTAAATPADGICKDACLKPKSLEPKWLRPKTITF
jgi:hypothetical protein